MTTHHRDSGHLILLREMKRSLHTLAYGTVRCLRRVVLAGVLALSLCTTAACGSSHTTRPSQSVHYGQSHQSVSSHLRVLALFPSDAPFVSGMHSANRWSTLGENMKKAVAHEVPSATVNVVQSSHLSDQVSAIEENQSDSDHQLHKGDVLFFVPARVMPDSAAGFGNMVGDRVSAKASRNSESLNNEREDSNDNDQAAQTQLSRQLTHLTKNGVRVIECARQLAGYTPSLFIQTIDPYQIGRLQAQQVVSKIKLDQATVRDPRRLIILVPGSSDDSFSHEFLDGVWSVIGDALSSHKVVIVGATHIRTEEEFLRSSQTRPFFLENSDAMGDQRKIAAIINQQLKEEKHSSSPLDAIPGLAHDTTELDAVIAGTDYAAQQTVTVLTNHGYAGSAATINPEVTLQSVVNNLAGNRDMTKNKVPDPRNHTKGHHSAGTPSSSSSDWPIISGFGGYSASVSLVTSGKQWITGIVDEKTLSTAMATICQNATRGVALTEHLHLYSHSITDQHSVQHIVCADIVPVTSENVKHALLDPGYASAADAGL